MTDDVRWLFMCFVICVSFLVKYLFMSFAHFLIGFFFFFFLAVELLRFFIDSGYKVFVGYVVCRYFFPICSLSFQSLNSLSESKSSEF